MHELVAVIQARMGSTRLPGKVLLPMAGESVLNRVVRAAGSARCFDEVVVATSTDASDGAVAEECERAGVPCVRGPADDVLSRFVASLDAHPCEAIMRLTADCPLLDPEIVRTAVDVWRAVPGLDYLSTALVRTLPRGLDVEIVGSDVLRSVDKVATGYHRAHVTSWVYTHPDDFRIVGVDFLPNRARFRLTLDTPDDWALMQRVADAFGTRQPRLEELTTWLDAHPETRDINAHVAQKHLDEG